MPDQLSILEELDGAQFVRTRLLADAVLAWFGSDSIDIYWAVEPPGTHGVTVNRRLLDYRLDADNVGDAMIEVALEMIAVGTAKPGPEAPVTRIAERRLDTVATRCGLNADWCNQAWFFGPQGSANRHDGPGVYIVDTADETRWLELTIMIRELEVEPIEVGTFIGWSGLPKAIKLAQTLAQAIFNIREQANFSE